MNSELTVKATAARENAVAPYSGFKVGAALETKDGRIYTGCNIENVSYGLTVCAERVALWKDLSEGASEFRQIAIEFFEQAIEARDQFVIGCDGIELGVVDRFVEPVVVFGIAAPGSFHLRIIVAQSGDDLLLALAFHIGGDSGHHRQRCDLGTGGGLLLVKILQLPPRVHDKVNELVLPLEAGAKSRFGLRIGGGHHPSMA